MMLNFGDDLVGIYFIILCNFAFENYNNKTLEKYDLHLSSVSFSSCEGRT